MIKLIERRDRPAVDLGQEPNHDRRFLARWWRYAAIFLLVLGIAFRFTNLEQKVVWVDETHTLLRSSGYRRTEAINKLYTGEVVSVKDLLVYQRPRPKRGWSKTWRSLRGNAEHTPLYFLLVRAWMEWWGSSIAIVRSLSAVMSLLVFPAAFWLCWELFASSAVAWTAVGLMAISPLQVLYAQEARPYSLLIVITLVSSAVLLKSLRTNARRDWAIYAVTLAIGLYTQLLFGLVAIAHTLYVMLMEQVWVKRQFTPGARNCLLATGMGLVAFVPWLVVLIPNLEQVRRATVSVRRSVPFGAMMQEWCLNLNRVFLYPEHLLIGLGLVALVGYALYQLCRTTPTRTWLLIFTLIGVFTLALVIPDVVTGGQRSLRIRYLIPTYVAIQIAVAYWLTRQALWLTTWKRYLWRLGLVGLVIGGITACAVSADAEVWWNKELSRSSYFPPVAQVINAAEQPLVITDDALVDSIAFSHELKPEVKFQFVKPKYLDKFQVDEDFQPIFLLNASDQLRDTLQARNYQLQLLYHDENAREGLEDRLWLLTR